MSQILDEEPLWKAALVIAADMREAADELPEEERWGAGSKLRFAAGELAGTVASALGAIDPRDVKLQLSRARQQAFTAKGLYVFGHKSKIMKLDPDAVLRAEALVQTIDARLKSFADDMNVWYQAQEPPALKESK